MNVCGPVEVSAARDDLNQAFYMYAECEDADSVCECKGGAERSAERVHRRTIEDVASRVEAKVTGR